MTDATTAGLEARVREALREVVDPELGLDVVSLGLVYGVELEGGRVRVRLTMTTPACPLSEQIVRDAEERVAALAGVEVVNVELVWEPLWGPERMSPAAKETLGWRA
jgi:metal-sulfur cluster biosynthetic enzyme